MFSRGINGSWGNSFGTGATPNSPLLVLTQADDDTGIVATMSGESAGSVNNLFISPALGTWVDQGSGWDSNNEIEVTLTENGVYYGYIFSFLGGGANISQLARFVFAVGCDIQADDNIGFVLDAMTDTAVYWCPEMDGTDYDNFGKPIVNQPIEINVRYEEVSTEVIDAQGSTVMSKATIYADRDLATGGIIMLGTLDDVDDYSDPKANKGAWEIIKYTKLPTLDGSEYLRQAFL